MDRKNHLMCLRVFSLIVLALGSSVSLTICNLAKVGLGDAVDITPPVVTVGSPAQNSYVRGTLTVAGTASDDIGITSLSIQYPGQSGTISKTVAVTNGAWSVDIPTGTVDGENLPDGEQQVSVTARDASGKEQSIQLIAFVDNIAPTVLITVPQGYGGSKPTTSDYIDIKGEVWDRSPVTEVNVSVFNTSGIVMETRHADGTNTWSTRFLTTGYPASPTDPYSYSVEAKDKAGNTNTYYYHSVDIWALLTTYGGTLFPATDEIGKVDQDKSGAAGVIPYLDLYGHRLGYPGGPYGYGDFYKTDDATLPVITFSNLDPANPIQDNVISTKVPINGYINPGPAQNTVLAGTLKARIIPWSATPVWPGTPNVNPADVIATGISSSVSFQIEPKILGGAYIPSGRYMIRVDAGASGTSSVASELCSFIVDSGAPRIAAVQPADLSLVRRKTFAAGTPLAGQVGIEIRVNLQDDNSVHLSAAVAALTSGGTALPGMAWDGLSGPDTWYTIQVPLGAGESEIWFELEGKDDVNTITRKTVHYTIDETAPTVVIVSPSDGSWVTGNSTTVSGTSSDNTGLVSTIYIWLDLSLATPPADITTWNSLTGNASWVTTLPLSGEGAYTVRAVAVDFADNQSPVATRTFTLDQSNPTLTETSIGPGTVLRNAGFILSGTAADTNALSSITVTEKRNGGAPTTVLSLSPSGTSQVYTYNKTVNAGTHADDGTYEFTITTADAAGKTAPSITRTVIVDTEAPLLVLEGFTSGYNSALSQVNGVVVYKFSADGGIVSVEKSGSDYVGHFTVVADGTPVSTTAADIAAWASYTSTSGVFTLSSDSAAWGAAGAYDLYIGVRDSIPGTPNASWAKIDVNMDQNSDRPVISFTNLTVGAPAQDNPLGRNARILGNIQDDDGVGPLGVQIRIDENNDGDFSDGGVEDWTAVSAPPPSIGTLISWSHDISTLTQGIHRVQVRSRDKNSSDDGVYGNAGNYSWNESPAISFFIDFGPPVLAITGPANGAIKVSDFTITGTAQDSYGIDVVHITMDGGLEQNITDLTGSVQNRTWSYPFLVAGQNGAHTYQIKAIDLSGAETTLDRQFVVDTTSPSSSVNTPQAAEVTNGTLLVSGTAADNYQLANVYYWLGALGAGAPDYRGANLLWDGGTGDDLTGWTALSQTYSWQFNLDTLAQGDGAYTLHVLSLDTAGNIQAVETTRNFSIDKASDRPVLSVSTLNSAGTYAENLLPNTLQVAGMVSDDDSVDGSALQVAVDNDGNGTFNAPGVMNWTTVSPAVSDGRVVTWSHTFTGLTDGQYELFVRAADIYDSGYGLYSSASIGPVRFSVDTAAPAGSVTYPSQGAYLNATSFNITGTATDANGIASVMIKVGAADPAAVTNTGTNYSTWRSAYSYVGDGQVSYQIIITDVFNKITTIDRYFTMDRTAPTVSFIQPSNGSTVNGSLLVRGEANDNYQVSQIYFAIAQSAPAYPGGYSLLAGTYNWQKRVKTTSLTNGAYTLYVVSVDAAGNNNSASPQTLDVTIDSDANLPTVSLTTSTGTLFDNTGAVMGTFSDDDGVDASTIQINLGDGAGWVAVSSHGVSGSIVSFSHSVAGLAERTADYPVQVRASDVGENFDGGDFSGPDDIAPVTRTSAAINIKKDNAPPTASITSLNNGLLTVFTLQGVYLKDQLTLIGTSTDGVQVSTVEARLLALGTESFETVTNTGTNYSTWTWAKTGLALSGSSVNLEMRVTDHHARVTTYAYTLLVDITAPTASIDTPASNPSTTTGAYNGSVTFRGSAADGVKVEKVYYRFGTSAAGQPNGTYTGWTQAGSTYSWTTSALDTNALYNDAINHTYHLSAVSVDSAGNESTVQDIALTINQGSDRPGLTVSEPTAAQLFGSGAKAFGSTTDDDGLASIEVRIDANNDGDFSDGGLEDYAVVSSPVTVSGTNVSFEHNLAALIGDGSYKLQIRVRDTGYATAPAPQQTFHEVESAAVSFNIDTAPPALTLTKISVQDRYGGAARDITSGFSGSYINNDSTFTFTATDASGIASVELSADGGSTWLPATNAGGGTYTRVLTIPLNQTFDGTRNIQYRATDAYAKVTTGSATLIVDTLEPAISFTSPSGVTTNLGDDAPNVNGDVIIQGTVSDSSSVTGVTIRAGISDQIVLTNTGNNIAWKVNLASSSTYANGTYAISQTFNIWRLPVKITATELAGNRTITTGYIDIDPDSDRPIVSVVSPASGDSVAGVFLINGTVVDDDGAQSVRLQVDLNNDGVYGVNGGFDGTLDLDGDGNTTDDFEKETEFKTIGVTNGAWTILMNTSGELNKSNLVARGLATADGHIGFQATPVDIYGTLGAAQTVSIYIDSEAPVIKGLLAADGVTEVAAPTPATGTLQKGTVTLRALFKDDKELLTPSMQVSFDGGSSYQNISSVSGATITYTGATNPYAYRIVIPIDTTTVVSGGNGTLQVSLKVTDKTYKQTTQPVQYSVDNTLPEVAWNLPATLSYQGSIPNEIYSFYGSGATINNQVFGKASDTGTISGIAKVNVYFVKGGNFRNPTTGGTVAVSSQIVRRSSLDRNGDGDYTDPYEYVGTDTSIPFTEDSNLVVTIDKRTELGQFDTNPTLGDNDGFNESLKAKSGYDEWYAYFNSAVLPDGPIDVYFVACDEAGNRVYDKAIGQVTNNPPSITGFTVGGQPVSGSPLKTKKGGTISLVTSAMDSGAGANIVAADWKVAVARKFANGGGNSIGTEDLGFTSFFYGSGGGAKRDFSARGSGASASSTLSVDTVNDGFVENNWYLVTAEVKDSDGNIATRDFYLLVNNNDVVSPIVGIDDITRSSVSLSTGYVEEAGFSLNDAAGTSGPVTTRAGDSKSVTSNALIGNGTIQRGWIVLFTTGEWRTIKSFTSGTGTITWETALSTAPDIGSTATVRPGQADISGTVTLRGTAWDDTAVTNVQLSFNGGTSWVSVTSLSLVSSDVVTGNDYTWTYNLNTATVDWDTVTGGTQITGLDRPIMARALDGTNTGTLDGDGFAPTKTAEVVPYISQITRDTAQQFRTNRSNLGTYSVFQGETNITVSGFNLNPGWARIYSAKTAGNYDAAPLTVKNIAGAYTSFQIDMNAASRSGWLRIDVNGIDAINNNNDGSRSYNMLYGTDGDTSGWSDDRYLFVWKTGEYFQNSTDPQHPTMTILPSTSRLFGAWSSYATSDVFFASTNTDATSVFRSRIYHSYDTAEYLDIALESTSLNDGNNPTSTGMMSLAFLGNNSSDGNYADGHIADFTYERTAGYLNGDVTPTDGQVNLAANAEQWNRAGFSNWYYRGEGLSYDSMLYQFQGIRTARSGNNVHWAYYDQQSKTVKYAYVVTTDNNETERQSWINIDGATGDTDGGENGREVTQGEGSAATRTTQAGEFLALALDDQNYPAVVYYDMQHQTLRLARSNSATPTAAANWTRQDVFAAGDINYGRITGKHISAIIDNAGYLHIAFWSDDTGYLYYIKSSNDPDGGAAYAFANSSVVVDDTGTAGTWSDITLDHSTTPNTPYICYLNSARVNTKDGLKIAYNTDAADQSKWEYMIAPIATNATSVVEKRTSIEFKRGGAPAWNAAIGYASSSRFELIYLMPQIP